MKARKREKTRRNEGKREPDITTTEPRVAATERENGVAAIAEEDIFITSGFFVMPIAQRASVLSTRFTGAKLGLLDIHTFYLSLLLLSVYVSFLRFEDDRRVKIPRIVRFVL